MLDVSKIIAIVSRNHAFFHKLPKFLDGAGCFTVLLSLNMAAFALSGAKADTLQNYLVQEVCDNGSGGHTTADPVTCPSTARKLNIGESLPYHKWDVNGVDGGPNINNSFPVRQLSGLTRVVSGNFFEPGTFIDPRFDASDPNSANPSAYDIYTTDGTYVSIMGTNDPGGGWEPIWSNGSCSLSDSWLVGSKTELVPYSGATYVGNTIGIAPQCPSSVGAAAYTAWNYYSALGYESGKHLNTIKVWHWGGTSATTATLLEINYFTKEYGRTRWEAWKAGVSVVPAALTNCPTGTGGGVATYGTQTYYLQACHDWSKTVTSATGDWNPTTHWHIDPLYTGVNLLTNTHMQCTNGSGAAGACGTTYTCRTIAPWNRLGDLNWGYDSNMQAPVSTSVTQNCALIFNIPDAPSGQSVYQDVTPIPGGYSNYTFGTALWSPSGASLAATVVVFELNAGGIVAQHNVPASITGARQFFSGSFTLSASTTRLRFQIYPSTVNANYEFTESWIAPSP